MIKTVQETKYYTAKKIVEDCYDIRNKDLELVTSDDIDFLHGWDQLAVAYGILKDKEWNDNQIYKYLEGCKNTIIQERNINFKSIKNLK